MLLLIAFILLAVVFSFLCSVAEAVLLSTTTSYVVRAEQEGKRYGPILKSLKEDINAPLAVILTLNTVAHTIGAAGAGAQATAVFGSVYLGVFSAVLTLVILIFSEIIPKALGAHYWRRLAPVTGHTLQFLVRALYPFVWLSNKLTNGLAHEPTLKGFSREEFSAMAELGELEGQLDKQESLVLKNLLGLRDAIVRSNMTPRSVVFSMPATASVGDLMAQSHARVFSRIPLVGEGDTVAGFVLRQDIQMAYANGEQARLLSEFVRPLTAIPDGFSLWQAFEGFVASGAHIMLVVNEYGTTQGIITLEDVVESLLGQEIVDESDQVEDMQALARTLGAKRRKRLGLEQEIDADAPSDSGAHGPS